MEDKIRKIVGEYVDKNLTSVSDWHKLGEDQISHIKDVSTSIILERENIKSGGGFVSAIMDNDFEQIISRADGICLRALKLFLLVKLWVRI